MKLFGAGKPDHPMADRKEAARLLGELPAQDLKAVEELAHWYESLGAAQGFKAEERAQRLAMVDEAAQPRLRKLSREYLASVRSAKGSHAQQNLIWARMHEYWRLAGQAFAGAIDGKSEPGLVLGALRAFGQQLKWQQLRYGPIDLAVWGQMNRVFALAESRGIAEARVEYLRAAMFSAASPDTRPVAELELAERIIAELAPAFVMASAPALGLPYWTDLAQATMPARSTRAPQPSAGLRFFGPGTALGTLQNLIERLLAKRQVPAELKPAADDDPDTVLGVLRHLAAYWAPVAPERKHKRHSVQSRLTIAHGFDGVLAVLGGDPDDSLNFNPRAAGDSWTVDNVSAGGFGALAPQAKSEWLKVGALVAAQPDGSANWLVGTVRRVSKVSKDEVRVGVETLSRAPAVSQFAVRGTQQASGVLLPPAPPAGGDAAIALRAGVYTRGENLESNIGGQQHVYMPQGVSERGEDYEIVRFKEMVRES
jgi:hypothetical protein